MSKLQNDRQAWVTGDAPEEEGSFRVVESIFPPASRVQGREVPPPHKRARILLVDDEPLLLRALVRMLKAERPYLEVVAVPNALVAIEKLKEERFDVMVTDLQMPGLRGEELLEKALAMDPTLTCVVHSNQVLCLPAELRAKVRSTLNKPATMAEVCATLDDAVRRAEHLRDSLQWI